MDWSVVVTCGIASGGKQWVVRVVGNPYDPMNNELVAERKNDDIVAAHIRHVNVLYPNPVAGP